MYTFNEEELKILEFWKKNKTFEKLRKKNKGNKKFSFLDGPITANNPMGVHHAWGRTYKDLFQRFKAMQGFELRYQNGFDCQGLWVEREEEKELGLNSKEDIEKYGIKNFVEKCKKRVEKFSKVQTDQTIRLGNWMDWEHSYYTNTNTNNLHNWFLLKTYHKKGLLYKGNDVVPWCPRCETASSKHDIATEGYREVTHSALFMQFPVKGKENEYFLIFTTTPWTVPCDVAIAVNENITYVLIVNQGLKYWIAEKRLQEIKGEYKILEKKKGKQLAGMEYVMPYASLKQQKDVTHKVVLWDLASEEEGTGIVHIAPGCGAEDHELGEKIGLPSIAPLSSTGHYYEDFETFSLKHYSKVNQEVLKDLEERRFVYKIVPYKHRYPHCWRCSSELVFRLVDEWYIKCEESFREKLKQENSKIVWFPEYGKVRQNAWFDNMGDWMISQKRYYGQPLPFWECSCGHLEVIGSLEELKKKATHPEKIDKMPSLHRPYIDEIKINCEKCGKEVSRILDLGMAWLDAGIVGFSTIGPYLEDKKYWKQWFPADFITENLPGQYRGWFNALFWAGVTLSGEAGFKSLLGYETLKDEKGEEMHKSKGNAIWFDDAVQKVGADPMRLLYSSQDPAQELRFGYNVLKDPSRDILILFNIANLVEKTKDVPVKQTENKWILSKLHGLTKKVTEELNQLHPHLAARSLREFWLKDFSRTYIQFVREKLSDHDPETTFVLKEVYLTLLKLCAPFIPFVTEAAWQILRKKSVVKEESVHLSHWPKADIKKINHSLETNMVTVLRIIEMGLAQRSKEQIGLRWPLANVTIFVKEKYTDLSDIIATQLNVKEVIFSPPKTKETELTLKLDTVMTPELEAEGYARELSRFIQGQRKKMGLNKENLVETYLFVDDDFRQILDDKIDFIKERTNSKKVEFVATGKERFKKKVAFNIRHKRGELEVVFKK